MSKTRQTVDDVIGLIYHALRRMNEVTINDVTMGLEGEIVLTIDNGSDTYQTFVIDSDGIRESDASTTSDSGGTDEATT